MTDEQPVSIPPLVAQEVGLLHLQLAAAQQEIIRLNQVVAALRKTSAESSEEVG
jgi:hypothetical protein